MFLPLLPVLYTLLLSTWFKTSYSGQKKKIFLNLIWGRIFFLHDVIYNFSKAVAKIPDKTPEQFSGRI